MRRLAYRLVSVQRNRAGHHPDTPHEPEYHEPTNASPLPPGSLDEMFAEMAANDEEFIEWRRHEENAMWATRR